MIKFDLILLNEVPGEMNGHQGAIAKANAEAQRIQANLYMRFSNYSCPKHPKVTNRVQVIATDSGEVMAKAINFCCIKLFPKAMWGTYEDPKDKGHGKHHAH